MVTVDIDDTTEAGMHILDELADNPEAGKVREFKIPRDENGNPIGIPAEEVFAEIDRDLSEHFGIDFAKVTELVDSGKLNPDEITDELLYRPEYKYEPYPGFKPRPLPEDFEPDPLWKTALGDLS
jgi:hypothetical protein